MINEKGFALVAMAFILVSFISVVFLVCYSLIKEAREDTDFYIIDRNWGPPLVFQFMKNSS